MRLGGGAGSVDPVRDPVAVRLHRAVLIRQHGGHQIAPGAVQPVGVGFIRQEMNGVLVGVDAHLAQPHLIAVARTGGGHQNPHIPSGRRSGKVEHHALFVGDFRFT